MGVGLVLESELYSEMLEIYKRADLECNYRPTKYLNFISVKGGIKASKELLLEENDIFSIKVLAKKERLDITIEALVTKKEYKEIFTEEEVLICKERLERYKNNK